MCIKLTEITWQTVATIATLIAVVVALIPIWRDAKRKKAYARNLRIRLCSKLSLLQPSLKNVGRRDLPEHPATLFSSNEFRETVSSIAVMMQESTVLQPKEQDQLGMAFTNLEIAASLYGTTDLTVDTAKAILRLIQQTVSLMEKNGLLHGEVNKPWDDHGRV